MKNKDTFILAVENSDIDTLKHLFATDKTLAADIDAPVFKDNAPAIVFAAATGNRELIKTLLEAGADINAKSTHAAGGTSALHHATGSMLNYDPELAKYLIDLGATLDAHAAAGLDQYEELAEHIKHNPAAVNASATYGMLPLHFAATPRIAELLLTHGADINRRDKHHNGTPAQWTLVKRPAVCQYLLDQGAEGDLVLYCAIGDIQRAKAAIERHPELLNLRIKSDVPQGYIIPAAPGTEPPEKESEMPGAHVYTHTIGPSEPLLEIALKAKQPAIIDLLIATGYQIKLREWYVITGQGPKKMDIFVKHLLNTGWDINAPQKHPRGTWTPLHWLAQRGLTPGIKCLLENGADPNVRDDKARTPMHIIAQKGIGQNQMQLLIQHGGDINLRDENGRTPLECAQTANKKSIKIFLETHEKQHISNKPTE